MIISRKKFVKVTSLFIALNILLEAISPFHAIALTSGPGSPEFDSFTPVATTDMVDVFTGDFNYNLPVLNIPGPDGGGYALSLSYNSGVQMEQEASWVGFGWTLNPGAISRSTRGFPDDMPGKTVKYYNKSMPNWTASAGTYIQREAGGKDLGLNLNANLRFNNYNGYQASTGAGLSFKGMASIKAEWDPNGFTFSADINPYRYFINQHEKLIEESNDELTEENKNIDKKEDQKQSNKNDNREKRQESLETDVNYVKSGMNINLFGSQYGLFTYSSFFSSRSIPKYYGLAFNMSYSPQLNPGPAPVGYEGPGPGGIPIEASLNIQFTKKYVEKNAYGMMYCNEARNANTEKNLMDYYMEKDGMFDKRDHFIGIPFANYDIFSVTGEGLGGGFQLKNENVNYFRPEEVKSNINILQLGFEFMSGYNVGAGVDFGVGNQKTHINEWDTENSVDKSNNPYLFRFANDMGGCIEYSDTTDIESATLDKHGLPGFQDCNVNEVEFNKINTKEASSAINYYKKEDKNLISGHTNYNYEGCNNNDNIVAMEIINKDGTKYIYGQPVFVRNESNLYIDIDNSEDSVINRDIAFTDIPLKKDGVNYNIDKRDLKGIKTLGGKIDNNPNARNFLLTQITSYDYIDVNDNGPDRDDFGSWTKFTYRKKYGGDDSWYRYRSPYKGFHYNPGSLSVDYDDIGSMVTGEKEVYYLKTIETKTHIACFVTNKTVASDFSDVLSETPAFLNGTGNKRKDGLGAPDPDNNDPAGLMNNEKDNTKQLEYLEKIVLLSKTRIEKPLQIIHFKYDYSLVPNLPNNTDNDYNYNDEINYSSDFRQTGKLTLKKVWFEYEGEIPVKISPYEFEYKYENAENLNAGKEYFQEYQTLTGFQNPLYNPYNLDPWGNIQLYGKERKDKDIPWIYQGDILSEKTSGSKNWRNYIMPNQPFDPAAYNLKKIKLPSGGSIHIQYEQKDYKYVQDRPVMAMASLTGYYDKYNEAWYDINPADLGANPDSTEQVIELKNIIQDYFSKDSNKVYFKFLYDLVGKDASLTDGTSDYITGYAKVKKVELVNDNSSIRLYLENEGAGSGEYAVLPREACFYFYVNKRQGLVYNKALKGLPDGKMNETNDKVNGGLDGADNMENEGLINQLGKYAKDVFGSIVHTSANSILSLLPGNLNKPLIARDICKPLSFLKLPMYRAKKGDGVRVKSILMYDPGIESGDAAMYGTEYHYVLEDGVTSSGVATNEPAGAREENPLVGFLPKEDQTRFNKLTVGEDKEQTEGPVGESVLPAPYVGHSRVVINNIHTKETGTGYQVMEYYTAKDYPFDRYYSKDGKVNVSDVVGKGFDYSLMDQPKPDFMILPAGLMELRVNKVWSAQGFRFVLNNMHGQIKKVSGYGGNYYENTGYPVSLEEYTYYEPGEKVELYKPDNGTIDTIYEVPGKEEEIAIEAKEVRDVTWDFTLEGDISAALQFPPPIFVTIWPAFDRFEGAVRTHAVSKIIRYPTMLRKVKSCQDGICQEHINEAFDYYTGDVVKRRYEDNRGNSLYAFDIPASWYYEGMGQYTVDQNNSNQLNARVANILSYGKRGEPSPQWIETPKSVLDINIQTYADGWNDSWTNDKINSQYNITNTNELEAIYRPAANYVYKKENTSQSDKHIDSSGFYDIDIMFDAWNGGDPSDSRWLKTNEIALYSPNGNPLQEYDLLRNPSAVIYGYDGLMPVMIGKNAMYNDLYFNDFEEINNDQHAHSGEYGCLLVDQNYIVEDVIVSDNIKENGAVVSLWLYNINENEDNANTLRANINNNTFDFEYIARTGEWMLFRALLNDEYIPNIGEEITIGNLAYDMGNNSGVYIDDVRFQPQNTLANCYVYDIETLRLVAEFDDQHFGTYYQYNEKGQLVRKIKETERGMKTIQETQYHLPELYDRNKIMNE